MVPWTISRVARMNSAPVSAEVAEEDLQGGKEEDRALDREEGWDEVLDRASAGAKVAGEAGDAVVAGVPVGVSSPEPVYLTRVIFACRVSLPDSRRTK